MTQYTAESVTSLVAPKDWSKERVDEYLAEKLNEAYEAGRQAAFVEFENEAVRHAQAFKARIGNLHGDDRKVCSGQLQVSEGILRWIEQQKAGE